MKETELSINQIESAIVESVDSPFYIRRNIVIPNVSWGFLNHEADLLVISQKRTLTEIEIKRTWADFMADFHKGHNHYDKNCRTYTLQFLTEWPSVSFIGCMRGSLPTIITVTPRSKSQLITTHTKRE